MKKEFKTPVINVCTVSTADVIMTSYNANVLGSGGTNTNMFSVTVDINEEYKKWQDWI